MTCAALSTCDREHRLVAVGRGVNAAASACRRERDREADRLLGHDSGDEYALAVEDHSGTTPSAPAATGGGLA